MPLTMYNETNKQPNQIKNIIGVAAGKGGVGKSTTTINLALALVNLGKKVGVLDADVYGPSTQCMLAEASLPFEKDGMIMPATSQGLAFVSIAHFRKKFEATIVRAPLANQIIDQFLEKVKWGNLDYLLIDFPPGTGDIQLTLMQKAALYGAVIVTTPQEVALLDVRKSIQMFQQMGVSIIGVVENMSYFEMEGKRAYPFGKGGGKKLAEEFEVPLIGEIPISEEISKSGDLGKQVFGDEIKKIFTQVGESVQRLLTTRVPIEIKQKDAYTFTINWDGGDVGNYRLSDLQKNCPCARCAEGKNRRLSDDVQAKHIKQIGGYALKITFDQGCSSGIYTYEYLRTLNEK